MKRSRIGSALTGTAVCALAWLLLWPHAREAGAILAAQHDPALLADAMLDSALRNNPATVERNIEAALVESDADLARSFVALAAEKDIPLSADLTRRVSEAVTQENSSAHFATRFASGLMTGNADDVASLTGTAAGDLFVFGDIRDVVREGKHLAMGEEADRLVLGLDVRRCGSVRRSAGADRSRGRRPASEGRAGPGLIARSTTPSGEPAHTRPPVPGEDRKDTPTWRSSARTTCLSRSRR